MNPTFTILGYVLSTYHLFMLLAIIGFIVCMKILINRYQFENFEFFYYLSLIFVLGFLGAKVFYLFEDFSFANFKYKLTYIKKGYVLYGGLLMVFLSSYLYAKSKKINAFLLLDLNSIALCLSIVIGKIACLMAGCCYGIPTNIESIGLVYTNPITIAFPKNEPLFPIQIIDSLFALVLFAVLLFLNLKIKMRNGSIFILFCTIYPIYRFLSETYRADTARGFMFDGMLSLSQFYSILVLLFALFYFVFWNIKLRRKKA